MQEQEATSATSESAASAGTSGPSPIPEGFICAECGYDVRGLTGERCPECGADLATVRAAESQLPWVHRKALGRIRAYWQTVWLITRRPLRFYLEVARPVEYRDAVRFARITLAHVAATAVAVIGLLMAPHVATTGWEGPLLLAGGTLVWAALLLALLPRLSVHALLSRKLPDAQRERAVALNLYAWAPLALLLFVLVPIAVYAGVVAVDGLPWLHAASLLIAVVCPLALFGVCLVRVNGLAARLLPLSRGTRWMRVFLIALAGVLMFLVTALVPLSLFYVIIMIYSLTASSPW